MLGIIDAVQGAAGTIGFIKKIANPSSPGLVEQGLKNREKNMDMLISTHGNMTKLLSDFIVEPLVIITENASSNEITDKVAELTTDIFASFYLQTFEIINQIYGVDAKTTISLLGTDNGVRNLKTSMGMGLRSAFTGESADTQNFMKMLLGDGSVLTVEDSNSSNKNPTGFATAKSTDKFDKLGDTLGSALLQRNLEVTLDATFMNADGSKYMHKISLPVTIRARVIKVRLSSLLLALNPSKPENNITMSFLDYRAGLKSLGDFLFSSKLIKEYKEQRLKGGDEFLAILNERRVSAVSKLATAGAIGFEKNYNSYIITDEDRVVINRELGGDIYTERYKDILIRALDGLSVSVLDEDHERLVVLTSDIRGMSNTSFKNLKRGKDKGADLSELVKALFNNRPMF